jgi:hypothetical protein
MILDFVKNIAEYKPIYIYILMIYVLFMACYYMLLIDLSKIKTSLNIEKSLLISNRKLTLNTFFITIDQNKNSNRFLNLPKPVNRASAFCL